MAYPTPEATLRATAIARADALYLDDAHRYGRGGTSVMSLESVCGPADPEDSGAAVALNSGSAPS